jgi:hypothetical protein
MNGTLIIAHDIDILRFSERVRDQSLSLEQMFVEFYRLYFSLAEVRYYGLLDMPRGTFERTCMGRQCAVMIVPDEIREEYHDDDGGITPVIRRLKMCRSATDSANSISSVERLFRP